jgi:D-alanyl-D-alanine carboxypeptidase
VRTGGKRLSATVFVCAALIVSVAATASAEDAVDARLMDILVAAYPDFLAGHDGNDVLWRDGTRMAFDDGIAAKSAEDRLEHPSLKDMFAEAYPLGGPLTPPAAGSDPGRTRVEPFFRKMYGDCRGGETQKSLVDVVWLPKKWGHMLRVTRVNGVAERLAAVSAELDALPARFDAYLFPSAGTFNCRVIAGTDRLSAHGTATAIDIATAHAHYWRWGKPGTGWRNEIPPEIVAVFEKHGFIWGGRWSHYDTMHFEYRPELIAAARGP